MRRPNCAFAIALLSLVAVGAIDAFADDELVITFRMESPDLPEDSTVYIAGSVARLGSWRPDKVPMEYVGNHVWSYRLPIAAQQTIEYKYTLGSSTLLLCGEVIGPQRGYTGTAKLMCISA